MSCPTGKIEHQSRKSAEAHANSIFKKDGHLPNIYVCPDCGYLHVGGGRASDRPVVRPTQAKTPWRERMVRPSAAKTLTIEDLLLNEFIDDKFRDDKEIATKLLIRQDKVTEFRKRLNIPYSKIRKHEATVKALLRPNPKRKEIAKEIGCCPEFVSKVAAQIGVKCAQEKGVAHHNYGRKCSPAVRSLISEKSKRNWAVNPNMKPPAPSLEQRKAAAQVLRQPWAIAKRKKTMKTRAAADPTYWAFQKRKRELGIQKRKRERQER